MYSTSCNLSFLEAIFAVTSGSPCILVSGKLGGTPPALRYQAVVHVHTVAAESKGGPWSVFLITLDRNETDISVAGSMMALGMWPGTGSIDRGVNQSE